MLSHHSLREGLPDLLRGCRSRQHLRQSLNCGSDQPAISLALYSKSLLNPHSQPPPTPTLVSLFVLADVLGLRPTTQLAFYIRKTACSTHSTTKFTFSSQLLPTSSVLPRCADFTSSRPRAAQPKQHRSPLTGPVPSVHKLRVLLLDMHSCVASHIAVLKNNSKHARIHSLALCLSFLLSIQPSSYSPIQSLNYMRDSVGL